MRISDWSSDVCSSDLLSRGQRDDATVWRFGAELDGDDALHGGGQTSGDLDRSGALFVSDAPASRALPLIWSTTGWGLYFNTLARVEHDLEQTEAGLYQAALHDNVLARKIVGEGKRG